MPGEFCYGAKPSPEEHLALTKSAASHPLVVAALAGLTALSGGMALVQPAPEKHPINWASEALDQGPTESCTGHALAIGCAATAAAHGNPIGCIPSPLHFYSCAGGLLRADATPVGKPPALQDNGRYLSYNIIALRKFGIVPMGPLVDGRLSDVGPANATSEPQVEKIEAGMAECLSGAHTVDLSLGQAALDQCAASLNAGISLYLGFDCGSTFQRLRANQVAMPTPPDDSNQGGHAVVILSFRINAFGQYEWLVRNSWGGAWAPPSDDLSKDAPRGCIWASSEWLLSCWEVWLLDESLIGNTNGRKAAA